MMKTIGILLLLAMSGLVGPDAQAVVFDRLYEVRVEVDAQDDSSSLEDAFRTGLGIVLVRVTGDAGAAGRAQYEPLLDRARDYLQRFGYVDNETLLLSFDGRALDTQLRALDLPIWGQERPATIVWLAVVNESGRREILSAEDADGPMQSLIDAADRRGIPIIFPLMDTEDRDAVSVSDVRGSFVDTIVEASERYQADAILIGDARANQLRRGATENAETSYRTNWTLLFAGNRTSWRGDLASGINRAADRFADQLAAVNSRDNGRQLLLVRGVNTLDAYGSVSQYLKSLSLVDTISVDRVRGDEVLFGLELRGDRQRLINAIQLSRILDRDQSQDSSLPPGALVYRVRP